MILERDFEYYHFWYRVESREKLKNFIGTMSTLTLPNLYQSSISGCRRGLYFPWVVRLNTPFRWNQSVTFLVNVKREGTRVPMGYQWEDIKKESTKTNGLSHRVVSLTWFFTFNIFWRVGFRFICVEKSNNPNVDKIVKSKWKYDPEHVTDVWILQLDYRNYLQ